MESPPALGRGGCRGRRCSRGDRGTRRRRWLRRGHNSDGDDHEERLRPQLDDHRPGRHRPIHEQRHRRPPGHVQIHDWGDVLAEPAGAAACRKRQLHLPERRQLFVLDPNAEGEDLQGHDHRHRGSGVAQPDGEAAAGDLRRPRRARGCVVDQTAAENVDVLAQQCGASSATKTATVQTTTAGTYSSTVQPLMNTAYTTKSKAVTSNAVTVRVRPKLRLTKVAAHRYSVRVSSATSFAGKYASFQRYNSTLGHRVARRACS